MLKIGIYYIVHNLGHTRFVFNLIKNVKIYFGREISILLIQIGEPAEKLEFKKYCKIVKLDSINSFINKDERIDKRGILKERILFLRDILDIFSPDVFITEFYPFVPNPKNREITFLLPYVKKIKKAKIYASIGYLMWRKGVVDILKNYYDGILCHFPKDYPDFYMNSSYSSSMGREQFSNIKKIFNERIIFTGFVIDKASFARNSESLGNVKKNNKIILASRGGGQGKDKEKFILNILFAAREFSEYEFIIVAGPYTSSQYFKKYVEISRKIQNAKLYKYVNDLARISAKAKLDISMAGYNKVVESLWIGKNCIIIPCRNEEQEVRADYVNNKYGTSVIFPEEFTPEKLYSILDRELSSDRKPHIDYKNFNGIDKTIELLDTL